MLLRHLPKGVWFKLAQESIDSTTTPEEFCFCRHPVKKHEWAILVTDYDSEVAELGIGKCKLCSCKSYCESRLGRDAWLNLQR